DSSLRLYRGSVAGLEKSWVRLAANGDALQGMIWDGTELYVIESTAAVLDALVPAAGDASADTIIFKLADVLIEQGAPTCASGSSTGQQKADAAFESLLGELKNAPAIMQAAGATRRLTVSALGDAQFLQRHASEAEARDAIAARLNNVDGIFSSQLGVEIRVGALFMNDATSAGVSSATSPNTLLRDLARQRRQSSQLNSFGLTHLFTGRDLDGTTIGIAYIGALCQTEYSAALTELRNTWLDSLVTAHEIGHTFGADHDGDPAGTCSSTAPSAYLMGAIVSGSEDFSQCSLNRMQTTMQTALCLAFLAPANVAVSGNLGTMQRAVSAPFQWELEVRNVGGLAAANVRADVNIPAALTIEDAVVVGGSCT
ncbi:MAG: M12 family metallo-peptidase, partial [Steroidobacteraceae bacterium]